MPLIVKILLGVFFWWIGGALIYRYMDKIYYRLSQYPSATSKDVYLIIETVVFIIYTVFLVWFIFFT